MPYEITIRKLDKKKVACRNWEKIYDAETFKLVRAENPEAEQYAYKDSEKMESEATEIYTQTVDELNIKNVINAVNNQMNENSRPG